MTEMPPPAARSDQRDWSVFGWVGVAILSFAVFAIVQTVALFEVLFRVHPEAATLFENAFRGVSATSNVQNTLTGWLKDTTTAPYLFLYALTGDGAMFGVAVWLGWRWLNASPSSLGFTRFGEFRNVWLGMSTGFALLLVSDIVAAIQAHFFGSHPEQVAELLLTHHGTMSFVFDMLSVVVIAPIAEEYLFRGIVFTGLAKWMPVWPAAILSGLIFGCAHLDKWSIVPLSTIGVGLALLYRRTGSLWPNVIAHATVNTISLVAVYYFPQLAT